MKLTSNPFLVASLGVFAASLPVTAFAVTKTNDTNVLNLPSSWTGGVAPNGTITTSAGVAQFDTSITGTGAVSYTLGGDVTWGMLRVDRTTATAGSLITITGANTITLNGNNSVAASRQDAILLNSATGSALQIDSNIILGGANGTTEYFTASRNLTLNGNVDLSGVNLDAFTAGGTSTYNGVLSNSEGTSNLVKSGNGSLFLSGANTYNGTTTVTAGTLTVSGTTNGTSGVTVNGGASLVVATGSTLTTTGILGTAIATGANITVQTGATLNAASANIAWNPSTFKVDGTLAITGNIAVATNASGTISGVGSITAGSFSTGNATTTVNFTNTGSMAITGDMTLAASTGVFNQSAGTISANGLLLNSGTSNTYALTGGRINFGSGGISGTGAAKTVNLGAGTVGARADWSSALAMSLTNAATGTTFNTLDSVDSSTARTIALSGVLSGSGQLVKAGAGTLTLTGSNTYTGATQVKAGKLVIGAGGSLGNTAVTVGGASAASSPTLGGVGTIAGATLISAADGGTAGTHSPGIATVDAGVGKQTFSNILDYGAGSIFEWDLNGNTTGNRGVAGGFDAVDGSGVLTVDGTASTGTIFKVVLGVGVTLTDSFWNTPNTTHTWSNIFSGFSSLAGGFDTSNLQVTGQSISGIGSFTISGTSLTWTAVPEPTSALAGLLLGVGLLRRNRATRFFRG